jgi:predicted nucleic acid-binding protein
MASNIYLFDTYALMEILDKNKNYEPYLESTILINDFIFAEFCYALFRENIGGAENFANILSKKIIHAKPETIKEAMRFRFKNKKRNLSIHDCVSYLMAERAGVKFLTGDKEFEKMENVEFVK